MTQVPQLPMWTVYENPADYPGQFVARLWDGMTCTRTTSVLTAATLEALRDRLPPELSCIGRMDGDDPTIVEVWL